MVRACQHVCHRAPRQRARVTHFELRVLLQGLVALGPQRDRIASVTSHQLCASKTSESRRNSIFPARRDSGVYLAAPSASRESRTAAGGRRFAPRRWHRTRRPSSRATGASRNLHDYSCAPCFGRNPLPPPARWLRRLSSSWRKASNKLT